MRMTWRKEMEVKYGGVWLCCVNGHQPRIGGVVRMTNHDAPDHFSFDGPFSEMPLRLLNCTFSAFHNNKSTGPPNPAASAAAFGGRNVQRTGTLYYVRIT